MKTCPLAKAGVSKHKGGGSPGLQPFGAKRRRAKVGDTLVLRQGRRPLALALRRGLAVLVAVSRLRSHLFTNI